MSLGDIMSTTGVFQHTGYMSTPGLTLMSVGDIVSTITAFSTLGGYHEECGGIQWVFSALGIIMSTLENIMIHVGGYHEHTGGCSVHCRDTMSTLGTYQD